MNNLFKTYSSAIHYLINNDGIICLKHQEILVRTNESKYEQLSNVHCLITRKVISEKKKNLRDLRVIISALVTKKYVKALNKYTFGIDIIIKYLNTLYSKSYMRSVIKK